MFSLLHRKKSSSGGDADLAEQVRIMRLYTIAYLRERLAALESGQGKPTPVQQVAAPPASDLQTEDMWG